MGDSTSRELQLGSETAWGLLGGKPEALEGLASLLRKSIKALVVLAVTLVVEVRGKRG